MFVGVQFLLLIALVAIPSSGAWSRPWWLWALAAMLAGAGAVVMAMSALGLGRSLTPTPVPVESGVLVTTGMYRWVRHPIYSGLLLVVGGVVLRSASWWTVVVGVVTVVFFNIKARWEEARLAEQYPDYPRYAASVGRFLPRP